MNTAKGKTQLVGCLMFLFVFLIWLPIAPFWSLRQSMRRKRFYREMAANGRIISWADFLSRADHDAGTIIVEFGSKATSRFWWTPDPVPDKTPHSRRRYYLNFDWIGCGGSKYHPFTRWCYEQYLNPVDGKALLAFPVQADFEFFPLVKGYEEQMRARFPRQELIILTYYDTRHI